MKSNAQEHLVASAGKNSRTAGIDPARDVCPQYLFRSEPQVKVNCDLHRLARFGANISDAHSCFIFTPADLFATLTCSPRPRAEDNNKTLVLASHHSLSADVAADCRISIGTGLIGWVAKHNRSIHVSPFELDSRTLGIYFSDQQLKSFVGIPIRLDLSCPHSSGCAGVLACDSKKSFAFSKLQIKLLEDLTAEISNTIELLLLYGWQGQVDVAWQTFLRRAEELASALGSSSIEILRIRITNFEYLERSLGTSSCLGLTEQIFRLLQQALPPHFPVVRLVNGDTVICLDNMTTSFYENKIRALSQHAAAHIACPVLEFIRASSRDKKRAGLSIEALVAETAVAHKASIERYSKLEKDAKYEHRRA